jgi:hypothetical protein
LGFILPNANFCSRMMSGSLKCHCVTIGNIWQKEILLPLISAC